jgi:PAS domain-containing protein
MVDEPVREVRGTDRVVEGLEVRPATGVALLVRAGGIRLREVEDVERALPAAPVAGGKWGTCSVTTVLLAFALALLGAPWLGRLLARRSPRPLPPPPAWIERDAVLQAVFRADPIPTVLIHMDSAQVVEVSRSFVDEMRLRPEEVQGRTLFALLDFSDPEAVRRLLSGASGELPFCAYRIGLEMRVARVRFYRIRGDGEDFACVSVLDQSELFQLSRALDGLDEALLVVRDGREIAYFNDAARRLLAVAGQPLDRWTEVKGRDHKIRAELGGLTFDARSVATLPSATGQAFTLLRLRIAEPRTAMPAPPTGRPS